MAGLLEQYPQYTDTMWQGDRQDLVRNVILSSTVYIYNYTVESHYKEHTQYEILDTTNTLSEPSPIEHCTFSPHL